MNVERVTRSGVPPRGTTKVRTADRMAMMTRAQPDEQDYVGKHRQIPLP